MPESSSVADTLAWAFYHKGVYATAIDLLKEALSKQPDNATYHYHIGLAYQKANDRAHAKEHLERVLKLSPNYARVEEIRNALAELARS